MDYQSKDRSTAAPAAIATKSSTRERQREGERESNARSRDKEREVESAIEKERTNAVAQQADKLLQKWQGKGKGEWGSDV